MYATGMLSLIATIFRFGPLIFGVGFMAPLIAALIRAADIAPPFGLSPLVVGLILGGAYGAIAQKRGRWI